MRDGATKGKEKENRERARELAAMARQFEKQGDYQTAREHYRKSLALYEDQEVKAAYFTLLATMGPM